MRRLSGESSPGARIYNSVMRKPWKAAFPLGGYSGGKAPRKTPTVANEIFKEQMCFTRVATRARKLVVKVSSVWYRHPNVWFGCTKSGHKSPLSHTIQWVALGRTSQIHRVCFEGNVLLWDPWRKNGIQINKWIYTEHSMWWRNALGWVVLCPYLVSLYIW